MSDKLPTTISTMDFVEDAADCLAKHESGYVLAAVHTDKESALCFSGNIHTREQLAWFRDKIHYYLDRVEEKLP